MPRPISISPTLNSPAVPPVVQQKLREITGLIDLPLVKPAVTFDAEGTTAANAHRITLQVRNRRGDAIKAGYIVHLWTSTTAGGAPTNTGQASALVAGTGLETILPNGEWRIGTDASGQIILDITIVGAATRYLVAEVGPGLQVSSSAIVWT